MGHYDCRKCGEYLCLGDCDAPIVVNPHEEVIVPKAQPKEKIEGVTQPSHYALFDDIETIEVIARSMTREQFKGYVFGNILKYRLRAGKKGEMAYLEKDMAKAEFYATLYETHKDKCYA